MSTGKHSFFGDTIYAHEDVMAEIWGPAANIAILLAYNAHRPWCVYLHGVYFLFVALFTLSTSIPILRSTGIIGRDHQSIYFDAKVLNAHYGVGISCLISISIVAMLGILTKLLNILHVKSATILQIRKLHTYFGYVILALCKANYFIIVRGWALTALIVQDAVFLVIFVVWKQVFPRMESKQIAPKCPGPLRRVRSLKELDTGTSYAIFANMVYDVQPLKTNHPAGFEIVKAVRNKDVDRYIYGSCAAEELPEVPIWSHSYLSFTLVGDPVARLDIPPTFEGLEEGEADCKIPAVEVICEKGPIYMICLESGGDRPFVYRKYREVSQLGRYFSITLNNKVTRLYTQVNFLVKQNSRFLDRRFKIFQRTPQILKPVRSPKDSAFYSGNPSSSSSKELLQNINLEIQITDASHATHHPEKIPIMFKAYPEGKFTESIVAGPIDRIVISEEKGEGLRLSEIAEGKIVIVAGGTGLFPFSDLIDLLYKDQLLKEEPSLKNQILALSPILSGNPFSKYTFDLFAAFTHLQDLHPYTLRQIIFLADRNIMNVTFRFTERIDEHAIEGRNIKITNEYFEGLLQQCIDTSVKIAKIWICGPAKMNEGVSKLLREKYQKPDLYLIV